MRGEMIEVEGAGPLKGGGMKRGAETRKGK